jgi:hypothetical protein
VEDGSVSKVFSSFEFFCSDDNFMSFLHFCTGCLQVCSRFLISLSEKNLNNQSCQYLACLSFKSHFLNEKIESFCICWSKFGLLVSCC